MASRADDPTSELLTREPSGMSLQIVGDGFVATEPLPAEGRVIIGRSGGCDIGVDVSSISRRHAALTLGATITIEDLGSSNGTRVRGERLEPGTTVEIAPNDVIEIGSVMVIVQKRALAGRQRRIWSHGYFESRLEDECARAHRSGSEFALIRLRASERDAAKVQELLTRELRPGDVIASYGPRDFEALLVDIASRDAEGIVKRLDERFEELEVDRGMACYPRDGLTAERLMSLACQLGGAQARERRAAEHGVMERLHRLAERVAKGKINVLLVGETGVGKEVLAERLHELSPRARGPLVRISCAALPANLLESELFGYDKGAFSGADRSKPGLIETAEGGSFFLDEIGELPLSLQPKLLRVLEERAVMRVGSLQPRPVDVRFIAATNRDLETEVKRGRFRDDLYFRLSGVTLVVPPLRDRADEIPELVRTFLAEASADLDREPMVISDEALELLTHYAWPGNVRELRNVIERAALLSCDGPVTPEHLPLDKIRATLAPPVDVAQTLRAGVDAYERTRIVEALRSCEGNQTRAAKLLGISRMTLSTRMTEYGLPRPRKAKRSPIR